MASACIKLHDVKLRHFVDNDCLLDFLEVFGHRFGYKTDVENDRKYDRNLEFYHFIVDQTEKFSIKYTDYMIRQLLLLFEEGFPNLLNRQEKLPQPCLQIRAANKDLNDPSCANLTILAMKMGVPLICQGVLHHPTKNIVSSPDLLVRSDLMKLFYKDFTPGCAADVFVEGAPALQLENFHYVVLNIKFITLDFSTAKKKRNSDQLGHAFSKKFYKIQLFLQNESLSLVQGFTHPEAYLGGRQWSRGSAGLADRGYNCFDRVGVIPCTDEKKFEYVRTIDNWVKWWNCLLREGHTWYFPSLALLETKRILQNQPSQPVQGQVRHNEAKDDNGREVKDNSGREIKDNSGREIKDDGGREIKDDSGREVKENTQTNAVTPQKLLRLRPELYPNMKNLYDFPYTKSKKLLGKYLGEITTMWYCGVDKRKLAHTSGIFSYTDPRLNAFLLGVTAHKTSSRLNALLQINAKGTLTNTTNLIPQRSNPTSAATSNSQNVPTQSLPDQDNTVIIDQPVTGRRRNTNQRVDGRNPNQDNDRLDWTAIELRKLVELKYTLPPTTKNLWATMVHLESFVFNGRTGSDLKSKWDNMKDKTTGELDSGYHQLIPAQCRPARSLVSNSSQPLVESQIENDELMEDELIESDLFLPESSDASPVASSRYSRSNSSDPTPISNSTISSNSTVSSTSTSTSSNSTVSSNSTISSNSTASGSISSNSTTSSSVSSNSTSSVSSTNSSVDDSVFFGCFKYSNFHLNQDETVTIDRLCYADTTTSKNFLITWMRIWTRIPRHNNVVENESKSRGVENESKMRENETKSVQDVRQIENETKSVQEQVRRTEYKCVEQYIVGTDLFKVLGQASNLHGYCFPALDKKDERECKNLIVPRADSKNGAESKQNKWGFTLKGMRKLANIPKLSSNSAYHLWIKTKLIPLMALCPVKRFYAPKSLLLKQPSDNKTNSKQKNNSKDKPNSKGAKETIPLKSIIPPNSIIHPLKIKNNLYNWKQKPTLEFFCDFETVNSCNDDFSLFPFAQDATLIPMIGYAYNNSFGQCVSEVLAVDRLTMTDEKKLIDLWLQKIILLKQQYQVQTEVVRVWCWSKAEVMFFETNFNSAIERHGKHEWITNKTFQFFDFLDVIKEEPVVIRGATNFGLKSIAKAMKSHGFIGQEWPESQVDNGLNAMVAIFHCENLARLNKCSIKQVPLFQIIAKYNLVDVLAMKECIEYLRRVHA